MEILESHYTSEAIGDRSQIEPGPTILELIKGLSVETPDDLEKLAMIVNENIIKKPLDNANKTHERNIRWERTAEEIFEDGYTYKGRGCTDRVIAFLGLCRALGLNAQFVKLIKPDADHAVAEVELAGKNYICDASIATKPEVGEITKEKGYKSFTLLGKGRDAWDLGITETELTKRRHELN